MTTLTIKRLYIYSIHLKYTTHLCALFQCLLYHPFFRNLFSIIIFVYTFTCFNVSRFKYSVILATLFYFQSLLHCPHSWPVTLGQMHWAEMSSQHPISLQLWRSCHQCSGHTTLTQNALFICRCATKYYALCQKASYQQL